jgi:TRAP-type C4-dicarboxylate transport system permease small subunit
MHGDPFTSDGAGGSFAGVDRLLARLCTGSAVAAGAVVVGVSLVVAVSVASRSLGLGSVRGDFELVELGCGVSAFLFLPLCQLKRGHIAVDLFTNWLPKRAIGRLEAFWEIVFAIAWAVIVWRFAFGLRDIRGYGDYSMMLGIPLWLIYLPAMFGAGLSALVALRHASTLWTGRGAPREMVE